MLTALYHSWVFFQQKLTPKFHSYQVILGHFQHVGYHDSGFEFEKGWDNYDQSRILYRTAQHF